MANESADPSFKVIVQEAEAAVASVKDPELRRVAFDKILSTLLDAKSGRTSDSKSARKKKRSKASTASKPARATRSKSKGPKAYVEELIADGFFDKPKTIADVKAELANRGHHIALTGLSGPLLSLTQERKLRRQQITPSSKGGKSTFAYSNW